MKSLWLKWVEEETLTEPWAMCALRCRLWCTKRAKREKSFPKSLEEWSHRLSFLSSLPQCYCSNLIFLAMTLSFQTWKKAKYRRLSCKLSSLRSRRLMICPSRILQAMSLKISNNFRKKTKNNKLSYKNYRKKSTPWRRNLTAAKQC